MGDVAQQARQATRSTWFEYSVRMGLVVYGVMHLLIGWLALQLAFGDRSGAPDQQGALHILAEQPAGAALLWVVGFGFVALALWQVTEALWGYRSDDNPVRAGRRLGSAGAVGIYVSLAVLSFSTAVGEGSGSGTDSLSAKLMDLPFGRLLVGAVGAVIWIVALVHIVRGANTSFDKDLQSRASIGHSGTAVLRIGQVGYVAKGVALGVVGSLFVWAAWTYDAQKSGGLDVALRTLLDAPVGPWLLVAVAVGIGCFGVYCFAWARYAKTEAG